jgi:DNA-binding response OmpR family regulator
VKKQRRRTDPRPPLRLLLVDDDRAVLFGFAEYFRSRGMSVDTAAELEQAQTLLAQESYDFVVSDLRLQGWSVGDGLGVLTIASGARQHPHTVLISAYLTEEVEREALIRGVDVVVRKPTGPPVLERTLLGLIRGPESLPRPSPLGSPEGELNR